MEPVKFPGVNVTYVAPGCKDLPTLVQGEEGKLQVISCWKPSEEDLAVLNAGGCVCLSVLGGQPPVALWAQEVNIID